MYWLTKLTQNKKLMTLVVVLLFGLLVMPSLPVLAQTTTNYGLDGVSDGLAGSLGNADLPKVVGRIINVALGLLGVIAVVIILIGGFRWMTAGGNEEKTQEARQWIFSGIIGLAIILSAWAITTFVFKSLHQAVTQTELDI